MPRNSKFNTFSREKKHRILAETLKKRDMATYAIYFGWMGSKEPLPSTEKEILDRIYFHTEASGKYVHEKDLLITTMDLEEGQPFLSHFILLDNLRSAHNVGSILRTVEAFRLGTVLFYGYTPRPTHKKVQETAMGAASLVPWREAADEMPGPLIALETSPNAIPIHQFSFPSSFTLAVGNEEYGLSDQILRRADAFITIPLVGSKNSLNVANAFAIAAHIIRNR